MILIVDDDYSVTESLSLLLKQAGYRSSAATTQEQALALLDAGEVRLVLQDMNFSRQTTGDEGLQLLSEIKARAPSLPVILITAWGSIDLAVAGMKAGASDFITKPWSHDRVLRSIETALQLAHPVEITPQDRDELDRRFDFSGIIGDHPSILAALELIGRIAPTDAPILITGESGTGKEVVADAIHRNSRRAAGPFVKVNLGGVPVSLFESEMFGHVRGAFTDAHQARAGRFETAHAGTLLLDEIGDLAPQNQVKLLRVLQDGTFEAVGSSDTRQFDVRVISATNRDLDAAVRAGDFREDLLYRLNLIRLHLPPLSERRSDIPKLALHFLARAREQHQRSDLELTSNGLDYLMDREWPGNIRQLEHLIQRAVLVAEATRLDADQLRALDHVGKRDASPSLPAVGAMTLDQVEKAMIEKSLARHQGNLSKVAESLGISRQALYRRLAKHEIEA